MIIKNLSYKNILNDVSLDVPNGINYVRGDNGSGKSILLDCISGINKNYSGTIINNDSIVYLNQDLYFYYRLKSRDFISFICTIEGIKDYKNSFFNYLYQYNLSDNYKKIWNTQIGQLSKGERVKLFFATICFINREWYIFDEPFAGVDKKGKESMIGIIQDLCNNNKNIIITSHETEFINYFDKLNTINID